MVVLRATQKVLRFLPATAVDPGDSSTALGDWYVERLVIDRRPLLLLMSSTSLLTTLTVGRDVRSLPERLPGLVASRLKRLGVPPGLVASEVAAMQRVVVAKTNSRSALGSLVEFRFHIPFCVPVNGWHDSLVPRIESQLADMPCRVTGRLKDTIWPAKDAVRLLMARWKG